MLSVRDAFRYARKRKSLNFDCSSPQPNGSTILVINENPFHIQVCSAVLTKSRTGNFNGLIVTVWRFFAARYPRGESHIERLQIP